MAHFPPKAIQYVNFSWKCLWIWLIGSNGDPVMSLLRDKLLSVCGFNCISSWTYFAWPSSRWRCCWCSCKCRKKVLPKCPPAWNRAECESPGISTAPKRRIFLSRKRCVRNGRIGFVVGMLLFSLSDHAQVSESGVGGVLHLFCDLKMALRVPRAIPHRSRPSRWSRNIIFS